MATIKISRSYSPDFAEHIVTADGDTIATAHKVAGRWSVKMGAKLVGIAPTESIATATLDRLAAKFADTLRAAGVTVVVG
jgi:uncharacterized protein (UPF0210 family)